VPQFLAKNKILTIPQSLYSPDLGLCKFWAFLRLTVGLKGCHFASVEEIKLNAIAGLTTIPNMGFQKFFLHRQDCSSKCVCAEG
jgi:hypothetical protein